MQYSPDIRHMPVTSHSPPEKRADEEEEVKRVVEENAVVVVGRKGCCMVPVMRALLRSHGVVPKVCVVGEGAADGASLAAAPFVGNELTVVKREDSVNIGSCMVGFPAVFIGGRLVGGLDRLMAVHISGELKPMLKQAGALWL